mmetsp:Transcript_2958/g.4102  ORF Transcript_2958/g.4102 Transcript_2958/m.4102 type:complete len:244 (-) Transcript_2958:14499-15230(-)
MHQEAGTVGVQMDPEPWAEIRFLQERGKLRGPGPVSRVNSVPSQADEAAADVDGGTNPGKGSNSAEHFDKNSHRLVLRVREQVVRYRERLPVPCHRQFLTEVDPVVRGARDVSVVLVPGDPTLHVEHVHRGPRGLSGSLDIDSRVKPHQRDQAVRAADQQSRGNVGAGGKVRRSGRHGRDAGDRAVPSRPRFPQNSESEFERSRTRLRLHQRSESGVGLHRRADKGVQREVRLQQRRPAALDS